MKKILIIALSLVVALVAFSSCTKEGEVTGKVTYTVDSYTGSLPSSDFDAWTSIDKLYRDEIAAVPGVTTDVKKFVMEGSYDKCDAAILNACKSAEQKAAKYTISGSFKLTVEALYANGGTTKNIYTHVFGK